MLDGRKHEIVLEIQRLNGINLTGIEYNVSQRHGRITRSGGHVPPVLNIGQDINDYSPEFSV
jgi:hypothetical protein